MDEGQLNIAIDIDGIAILPEQYIYADADGVVVSQDSLIYPRAFTFS